MQDSHHLQYVKSSLVFFSNWPHVLHFPVQCSTVECCTVHAVREPVIYYRLDSKDCIRCPGVVSVPPFPPWTSVSRMAVCVKESAYGRRRAPTYLFQITRAFPRGKILTCREEAGALRQLHGACNQQTPGCSMVAFSVPVKWSEKSVSVLL